MTDLVVIGAGGFARETATAVRSADAGPWRLLGFLDDNPALHGTYRAGVPILGPIDSTVDYPQASFVVCVGNPRDYSIRERIVARLGLPVERYATIVHPSAQVGYGCTVGPGSVLLPYTVLTADVSVGAHVTVMPHVVLTHDDMVADYATIASGVRLGGGVTVARGAYLGAGALVRESLSIGEYAMVGLGSVVLRDVPPRQIWVGNPARYLRPVAVESVVSNGSNR